MCYPYDEPSCQPAAPGDGCAAYYPAITTPTRVIISFSGITKGPGWQPADGSPPNLEFEAFQTPGTCIWNFNDPPYTGFWQPNPVTAHLEAWVNGQGFFTSTPPPVFAYVYENSLPIIGIDHFGAGYAAIMNLCPGNLTSARDILESIGYPKSDDAWIQAWGLPDKTVVLRTDRISDRSNLRIKFAYT